MKQLHWFFFLIMILPVFSHAEDETDSTLKNLAVVGTLLSWGAAATWGQTPFSTLTTPGKHMHLGIYQASENQTELAGGMYGRDFKHPLIEHARWHLQGYWEFDVQGWWADSPLRKNLSGWMTGITPVLQYVYHGRLRPYMEFGIGLRYLSNIQVGDEYKSTQFQFGDLVGFGIQWDIVQLGFRFLHISNAGIETPNPGTNYYGIKVDYAF